MSKKPRYLITWDPEVRDMALQLQKKYGEFSLASLLRKLIIDKFNEEQESKITNVMLYNKMQDMQTEIDELKELIER